MLSSKSLRSMMRRHAALHLALQEIDDEDLAEEVKRIMAEQHTKEARIQKANNFFGNPPELTTPPSVQQINWHPSKGLDLRTAKKYFPPGCTVRKDVTRHMRWQVEAYFLKPSRSKVFSKNTMASENDALLYCLQCAWAAYCRKKGGACPFELSRQIF